jgi:hypothetical protein
VRRRQATARCALLDGDRNDSLLEAEHREIALHAMREREVRIGFQQDFEPVGRVGPVGQVAANHMIVGGGSFSAGGRDGQAADVDVHGVIPECSCR